MHGARELALVAVTGAVVFALAFALRPLDDAVGRAVVGIQGLVLLAGGMAFLGGVDFLAPATAVLVIVFAALRRWWGALRVALVMLTTDLATRLLKLAFARPRPEYALVEAGGYAFPSGHASVGAAAAVLIAWFATRHLRGRGFAEVALVLGALWAAAMAFSRMVLGVHALSDVVAGIGFGMAVAGGILALTVLAERSARRARARTPAHPPREPA